MSNQSTDNLEKFFRDRAQNPQIEFVEQDWIKLKNQLNEELPIVFSWISFLKRYWFVPLLLIIPLTMGRLCSSENLIPQSHEELASANQTEILPEVSQESQQDISATEASISIEQAQSGSANNRDYTYTQSGRNDNLPADESRKKIQQSESNEVRNKENIDEIGYAVLEDGAGTGSSGNRLHFLSSKAPFLVVGPGNTPNVESSYSSHEIVTTPKRSSRWSVGVGYSPDFSTVGLGNFVAPGSRWMAMIEYNISARFSINTGANWVNNKYEAYGEDYHAPARYWRKGIVADEAYGECVMVDVPLNARYNFLLKGRSKAFVSAGASTYFLLKEDYYFHYDQYDPDLPDHWSTDKTTIYPVGIINFSAGFQYQIKPKSSIQIEPFIKIPTGGIGWGNVDLHTMGIYFMYRYHFQQKQK